MKFLLKKDLPPINFWLVTNDQVNLFKRSDITFSDIDQISLTEKNLTFDEAASFILLQTLFAKCLGKAEYAETFITNNEVDRVKLNKALSNQDITDYFIELLKQHNAFFYRRFNGSIVLMVAEKGSNETDYVGWTLLEGDKLALAVADACYKAFGYQDVHFDSVVYAGHDEFTMANVFYALERSI